MKYDSGVTGKRKTLDEGEAKRRRYDAIAVSVISIDESAPAGCLELQVVPRREASKGGSVTARTMMEDQTLRCRKEVG